MEKHASIFLRGLETLRPLEEGSIRVVPLFHTNMEETLGMQTVGSDAGSVAEVAIASGARVILVLALSRSGRLHLLAHYDVQKRVFEHHGRVFLGTDDGSATLREAHLTVVAREVHGISVLDDDGCSGGGGAGFITRNVLVLPARFAARHSNAILPLLWKRLKTDEAQDSGDELQGRHGALWAAFLHAAHFTPDPKPSSSSSSSLSASSRSRQRQSRQASWTAACLKEGVVCPDDDE